MEKLVTIGDNKYEIIKTIKMALIKMNLLVNVLNIFL